MVKDTHTYKGWLNSDSFWKRMWAVYGYSILASVIIVVVFYILLMILGLFTG